MEASSSTGDFPLADTSLWPVVVGALLAGLSALGGNALGLIGTARRDAAQDRREAKKRRADKFEELVAAVYDFDHWLDSIRARDVFGNDTGEPQRVSPFANVQAISSVYFPQFNGAVHELDLAALQYLGWIHRAGGKRLRNEVAQINDGFGEAYDPYAAKRERLLNDLKAFAQTEFQ
jgi:hypothetical protein